MAAIGPYGKWQLIKCIYLACIIWIGASFHLLNMVFYRWVSATANFWDVGSVGLFLTFYRGFH